VFIIFANHANISAWNDLYEQSPTVLKSFMAKPDFDERWVECYDIFSANDLNGFWLTKPVDDFCSTNFAVIIDKDCGL
jgi:hypothetical protein